MGVIRNILIPIAAVFIFGAFIALRLFVPATAPKGVVEPERETIISDEQKEAPEILRPESDSAPAEPDSASAEIIAELKPSRVRPEPGVSSEESVAGVASADEPAVIIEKKIPLEKMPETPQEPSEEAASPVGTAPLESGSAPAAIVTEEEPVMPQAPSVDEEELMKAVVRIKCGGVYGSGFLISPDGLMLSVAHIFISSVEAGAASDAAGVGECDVIFPRKHAEFGYYSEAHYRKGAILVPGDIVRLYKEDGFDVAVLRVSPLADETVFPEGFPYVKEPFCGPETYGDKALLFGYAGNIGTSPSSPGSILSRFEGGILQYGDVTGVKETPSEVFSGGFDYIPELEYTLDDSEHHPVTVIFSSNNFAGASGGLVFDASQGCVIGANSAVGTISGDPRVFGIIYNFNFPKIKNWLDGLR